MGTIDKTTYTLTCQNCETNETSSVLDKGSNWGGSFWQSGTTFKAFDTDWTGGQNHEPTLEKAICKICKSPATIQRQY